MFQNMVQAIGIISCVRYSFASEEIGNGKPAFLSSQYPGSSWYVDNINDGDIGRCSHTNGEITPYVYIDLENIYVVQRVVITNRGDCCEDRLIDGVVRIGLSANDVTSNTPCGQPVTSEDVAASGVIVRECDHSIMARFVSVSIERETGTTSLNLCEIEVFGVLDTLLYDSHCYKFSTAAATWSDAKSACENSFSTLLTINSEEERTYLTNIISSFESLAYAWTGLNDIAMEGNPVWLTKDRPVYTDYDHAQGNEEDGSEEMDCFRIVASDRTLRHADCQLEFGYVCEARGIVYDKYKIAANNKSPTVAYIIRSLFAVSPGACSLECSRLDACSSFSFNRMSSGCLLSTSSGQSAELTDMDFVDVYVSTSSEVICNK